MRVIWESRAAQNLPECLFEDSYSIAVGAKNALARRRSIALADLVDESWVMPPPDSALGSVALEAFRASGLDYFPTTVITEPADVRCLKLRGPPGATDGG
jgi:DNA-binding transcriptional LysR family regulator